MASVSKIAIATIRVNIDDPGMVVDVDHPLMTEDRDALLRQILNTVVEIKGEVGKLDGTVRALTTSLGDEKIRTRTGEMAIDERLRAVENKVHAWSAAAGLVGALLGYVGVHIK